MPAHLAPRISRLLIALACGTATLRAEPGMPFTDDPMWLVRDGTFRGKIFVAADASPEEREGAIHLAAWIKTVTGASPEVTAEDADRTENGVYVGASRRARAHDIRVPHSLSREAFAWETRRHRRTLFLVGESPLATRLAASRFIREHLGVEFLMPGDFGADWKPLRLVAVPTCRREFTPAFAWRELSGLGTPDERTWAQDNGLGKLPAMNHALWSVFDDKAYEENPDMFPILGGKRIAPSGRGGYEPQPNLANPASAEHAARRAHEFFQKNPEAPAFSLSINDNMTWDESPESRASLGTGKFFRNRPDYSDYVFGFMNRSATALRAKAEGGRQNAKVTPSPAPFRDDSANPSSFVPRPSSRLAPLASPRRFLTAYAYYHCENTPSFRVQPEVFPILTADRSEWRDPGFAAEDAALMTRWSQSGASAFGLYDYYYGRDVAVPRIFHRAQAASVKHAADCGAKLFYAELYPDWGFDGPKAWLAARLAWQPDAEAEALLNLYYSRAYGPAAKPMRKFFELAEARWANRPQPPRWIRFFREESAAELFPAPVCAEMRAALDEAERAFPNPSERTLSNDPGELERRHLRVRATSVAFAKTEAFVAAYEAKKRLAALPEARDAAGAQRVADALREALAAEGRHRESVRRWNVCALNPGAPGNTDAFGRADAVALAAAKCARAPHALPPGSPLADAAAMLAEKTPEGVVTAVDERFDAEGFRPATPGTWAARRALTIPKAPWRANLFEAEHTRFGYSEERAASGKGSLLVAGGDLAKLSRSLPVSAGHQLAAQVRHAGEITPGEHAALCIRFLDAEGRELRGGSASVALPARDAGWRTLATLATAPDGAALAEVQLRVMYQDAADALWFDDLLVRVRSANRGASGE